MDKGEVFISSLEASLDQTIKKWKRARTSQGDLKPHGLDGPLPCALPHAPAPASPEESSRNGSLHQATTVGP